MSKEGLLEKLHNALIEGDEVNSQKLAEDIVSAGIDPLEAIKKGATPALEIVGEKFASGEFFLPNVILAADAMKACMAVFKPRIQAQKLSDVSFGKVVIGTTYGDIHDLGKNLVSVMLSVAGFEVYDLGNDVPPKVFVDKAIEVNSSIIAMSTLITSSMYYQEDVIKYLIDMGLRGKYFVVVGGGCITPEWAAKIGADGWARHADEAVKLCKSLVSGNKSPPLSKPYIIDGMKGGR
jgi:corrinoid protein of di/trimethylamine methyltransferase